MREIKFRAIAKKEAKNTYADPTVWFTLESLMRGQIQFTYPEHWNFNQHTGLKDKNSKEIYEGDIVARPPQFKYPQVIGWEEITDGESGYRVGIGFDVYWEKDDVVEVIGNIYENPDLLK